jgi:hypothetical protein
MSKQDFARVVSMPGASNPAAGRSSYYVSSRGRIPISPNIPGCPSFPAPATRRTRNDPIVRRFALLLYLPLSSINFRVYPSGEVASWHPAPSCVSPCFFSFWCARPSQRQTRSKSPAVPWAPRSRLTAYLQARLPSKKLSRRLFSQNADVHGFAP